jgi:hypothetical protein
MTIKRAKLLLTVAALCGATLFAPEGSGASRPAPGQSPPGTKANQATRTHQAPVLGSDLVFADWPHILIEGWQDKQKGDEMARAFESVGIRSLRFNFSGVYSPVGAEAAAKVKAENKLSRIEYPWFALSHYINFIAAHNLTAVIGVNVEEGPDVAFDAINPFITAGLESRLVAVELSNEPWLNHRPWMPEEYASRAADIIERLTPLGVRLALPLTVGKERNTPTKLSDDEWNTRMLRALTARVDLKNRPDIYGVLHLYADGVRAKSIDYFNKAVRPFAPNMRYVVTEFNIRLSLRENPHLTNQYAMEFARKLAELMARPEVDALYVHAVPYHSVLYWSNGRKLATVSGQRDPRLEGAALERGWHQTPAGKVYGLYSHVAWNGEVIEYGGSDKQRYWAVKNAGGRVIVTFLNDSSKAATKKIRIAGQLLTLSAPARSIVCYDPSGQEIERLTLAY